MISYNNKEIITKGCQGCAYANHEFSIDCGMAYENEKFTVSQDWELPIKGFFIVSPKKHVEKLSELTDEERNEMFQLVNKTVTILRTNGICDRFDYIFEEKENRHLHIWILPRYEWMNEIGDDIIDNIGLIFDYAKKHFRSSEVYTEIDKINTIVKECFKS
jgi:diadenosine tetraphosphate (Ap4A) HIT family hydrolase